MSRSSSSGASSLTWAVITSVVFRVTYGVVPLVAIPVGLGELGAAGFGAWVTALSAASLVAFADLGVGTGLMTKLGALDLDSGEDARTARRLVTAAYALAGLVLVVVLVLLALSALLLDWRQLLNAPADATAVEGIVLITLASYACNIVALLVVRVQFGVGRQARANLWQAAGSLLMLAALLAVPRLPVDDLVFVALVMFTPVAVASANTLHFFAATPAGTKVRPGTSTVRGSDLVTLLTTGSRFVVVSLLMAAAVAVDPWIVTRAAELEAVPAYAVPYRIFAFLGSVAILMALPLWPRHAGAVGAGKVGWIRAVTRRMTWVCGAAYVTAAVAVFVVGPRALAGLVPEELGLADNTTMWVGLALLWGCQVAASPAFMVQNGAEVLGPQTVGYALVLAMTPVKVWAAMQFGYSAIPWVSLCLYVGLVWPACWIGYHRSLGKARANRDDAASPIPATDPVGR